MTEKLESFKSRNLEVKTMTTPSLLRETRIVKPANPVTNNDKAEESEPETEHRSCSRTGTDMILTDDELVEVEEREESEEEEEEEEERRRRRGEHTFTSRPIDFTTGRRMSDDSSEGEEEYFRSVKVYSLFIIIVCYLIHYCP